MTVVLKLDTKSSLFEPIEVEIDGKKLLVREITLDTLEKIQDLQDDLAAGSAKAIREALESLVEIGPGDTELLGKLPLRKIREFVTVLVEKSLTASPEEKNGSGPGDKALP
jgi:hypothetical protein